jgi:hypothetical protein
MGNVSYVQIRGLVVFVYIRNALRHRAATDRPIAADSQIPVFTHDDPGIPESQEDEQRRNGSVPTEYGERQDGHEEPYLPEQARTPRLPKLEADEPDT